MKRRLADMPVKKPRVKAYMPMVKKLKKRSVLLTRGYRKVTA